MTQEKIRNNLERLLKGFEQAVLEIKNKLNSDEEINEDFVFQVQDIANKPMSELYYEYLDEKYKEYVPLQFESNIIHDDGDEPEDE